MLTKEMLTGLLALSLFISCNDESETSSIVGNWRLVDWYDDEPRDINNDGEASTDLFSQWNGCKKQSILVLSPDYSGKIIYQKNHDNPNCKLGHIWTTPPWELENDDRPYIVFKEYDINHSHEIIELSDTTLILKRSGIFTCCDPEISYYTGGYLKFERE